MRLSAILPRRFTDWRACRILVLVFFGWLAVAQGVTAKWERTAADQTSREQMPFEDPESERSSEAKEIKTAKSQWIQDAAACLMVSINLPTNLTLEGGLSAVDPFGAGLNNALHRLLI